MSSRRSNRPGTGVPDDAGVLEANGGQSTSSQPNNNHNNAAGGTLPPPNTFSEYKRNRSKSNGEKSGSGSGFQIKHAGESGRRGIHPWHFLRISFRSASRASLACNILWPVVPAALAVKYTLPEHHTLIFILAYIAMVPCANLIGFAGQELARKVPHVIGVLVEITCGSIVEIVLFMVLLSKDEFYVIKAAVLGSILATMLLCLGGCFFAGGILRTEQTFSEAVSEVGSGLLLTAGVLLAVPTVFDHGLASVVSNAAITDQERDRLALQISHIIAILLWIAYGVYVFFQARTHHGIYDAIFEYDEHRDSDKVDDERKAKLTMTESVFALAIAITLVAFIAISLVTEIEPIIEMGGVTDPFMGLILVPLVEKASEHLTAIDEAFDNQMNLAISHVLGATLQTALFNAPLAVLVGWGLGKPMDLNFEIFPLIMLILSIFTVGRFLQDQKSNYLEGSLLVLLYAAIAVSAFYYDVHPPREEGALAHEGGGESGSSSGHERRFF